VRLPRLSLLVATAVLGLAVAAPSAGVGSAAQDGRLEGRAVLPFDTTAPGPPSGAALGAGPINGQTLPFPNQPVQGFSGILAAGENHWWAIPDNGYGRKENSADWLLRIYRVATDFKTANGGSGGATVVGSIALKDPDRKLDFPLVREDRLLTGADVDPESIFNGEDGTFWIGDEFGPWMLHVDRSGRVLEEPISLPGVKSPQNPDLAEGEAPTLGRSKGFEAAAPSENGRRAYVFLEGPLLADDDQRRRYVYELDLVNGRFTGRRGAYRTADAEWLVADAKLLDDRRLLVMERDDLEGTQVRFKRVYEIDLDRRNDNGFVIKRELVDLLDLRDPAGVSLPAQPGDRGLGNPFSFPLRSVESILPLPRGRLLIANDNNFPFDAGRHDGIPDGNEWIIVRPAAPQVTLRRERLRASPREKLEIGYTLARDATLTLEIRRGTRVITRRSVEADAGRDTITVRAPRKRGDYRVQLAATLGNVTARDDAPLDVRRRAARR
jgi:glycerophosphoryl diester phosphodiesterase